MAILLTGGAGYIGSHISVELLNTDKEIVILDNFSNSNKKVIDRIKKITNKTPKVYEGDLRNIEDIRKVFNNENIENVIHLAGLKAVGESITIPLDYYENNITGTLNLIKVLKEFNCKNIIFSSSATVYGDNKSPLTEETPKGKSTNPYGWTKWFIEQILEDLYISDNSWNMVIFRYFNPVGAHESGLIGEDPKGVPNNLTPYITQVAIGKLEKLFVFGNDYNTKDGTGVRDYIHIVDLAKGHILGLNKLKGNGGLFVYNLGTGQGTSVLEIIDAFEKAVGHKIPYEFTERREGDLDEVYCNADKAKRELGFEANLSIKDMANDAWNWQTKNPNGYK